MKRADYLLPWAIAAVLAFATVGLSFFSANLKHDFDDLKQQFTSIRDNLAQAQSQLAQNQTEFEAMKQLVSTLKTDLDRSEILADMLNAAGCP